jgi:hypothetical protein
VTVELNEPYRKREQTFMTGMVQNRQCPPVVAENKCLSIADILHRIKVDISDGFRNLRFPAITGARDNS